MAKADKPSQRREAMEQSVVQGDAGPLKKSWGSNRPIPRGGKHDLETEKAEHLIGRSQGVIERGK